MKFNKDEPGIFVKAAFTVLSFLVAHVTCSAQWHLIDNFEDYSTFTHFDDASAIGWHANTSKTPATEFYYITRDPYDRSNMGLYCELLYTPESFPNSFHIFRALPGGGIPPGETGTLFMRTFFPFNPFVPWSFGTADKPLEWDPMTGDVVAPGTWSDYNALVGLNSENVIRHRDGSSYVATNPPVLLEFEFWYSFWMVVENTWDESTTPPTCTGSYTLYVAGPGIGDGVSPILIPVGTDPPKDAASFRHPPADDNGNPRSISWFMNASGVNIQAHCSSCGRTSIDDIYFSMGKNLSRPPNAQEYRMYSSWPVYPDGDVYTGWGFLRFIHVNQVPFIWIYSLKDWIYMEEPAPSEPGAWAYFYR